MRIELNIAAIEGLSKAALRAAELTADEVLNDVISAKVMPFRLGDMQDKNTSVQSRTEDGEVVNSIATISPQARRLYFNPQYDFFKGENPNAGGKWFHQWITGDKKDLVVDKFKKILREEAKL